MIKQVAPAIQPKARGYFGIDAKVYGHMGHVDPSALKVCALCRLVREARHVQHTPLFVKCCNRELSSKWI